MKALQRRIGVLENSGPRQLSAAARQWLGWPITDEERAELADEAAQQREPFDWTKADISGLSKETQKWWLER